MRAETDVVHRKLAHYKGEQLEGLDVKTLGVLLAEMDAARTRVEAARQRKLLTSCPDDSCARSRRSSWSTRTCADGHSYEHHAIAAGSSATSPPQIDLPLAHTSCPRAPRGEYYVAERHRRVPRGEPATARHDCAPAPTQLLRRRLTLPSRRPRARGRAISPRFRDGFEFRLRRAAAAPFDPARHDAMKTPRITTCPQPLSLLRRAGHRSREAHHAGGHRLVRPATSSNRDRGGPDGLRDGLRGPRRLSDVIPIILRLLAAIDASVERATRTWGVRARAPGGAAADGRRRRSQIDAF